MHVIGRNLRLEESVNASSLSDQVDVFLERLEGLENALEARGLAVDGRRRPGRKMCGRPPVGPTSPARFAPRVSDLAGEPRSGVAVWAWGRGAICSFGSRFCTRSGCSSWRRAREEEAMTGKWITFEDLGPTKSGKTRRWSVMTKDQQGCLGHIGWFGQWRRYCYYPSLSGVVLEHECMRDLADFCESQTREQRRAPRREKEK